MVLFDANKVVFRDMILDDFDASRVNDLVRYKSLNEFSFNNKNVAYLQNLYFQMNHLIIE